MLPQGRVPALNEGNVEARLKHIGREDKYILSSSINFYFLLYTYVMVCLCDAFMSKLQKCLRYHFSHRIKPNKIHNLLIAF